MHSLFSVVVASMVFAGLIYYYFFKQTRPNYLLHRSSSDCGQEMYTMRGNYYRVPPPSPPPSPLHHYTPSLITLTRDNNRRAPNTRPKNTHTLPPAPSHLPTITTAASYHAPQPAVPIPAAPLPPAPLPAAPDTHTHDQHQQSPP